MIESKRDSYTIINFNEKNNFNNSVDERNHKNINNN